MTIYRVTNLPITPGSVLPGRFKYYTEEQLSMPVFSTPTYTVRTDSNINYGLFSTQRIQNDMHNPEFNIKTPNILSNSNTSSQKSSKVDNYNNESQSLNKNNDTYGPEFLKKVKAIAGRLKCNYRDLLAVMNSESGINAKSRGRIAVGLIQFTQIAIDDMNKFYGTSYTKSSILAMTPIEQLDVVEKYLKRAKSYHFKENESLSAGDLYSIVYLPGQSKNNVLAKSGDKNYNQNRGLDFNNDGIITKNDLAQVAHSKYVNDNSFA